MTLSNAIGLALLITLILAAPLAFVYYYAICITIPMIRNKKKAAEMGLEVVYVPRTGKFGVARKGSKKYIYAIATLADLIRNDSDLAYVFDEACQVLESNKF